MRRICLEFHSDNEQDSEHVVLINMVSSLILMTMFLAKERRPSTVFFHVIVEGWLAIATADTLSLDRVQARNNRLAEGFISILSKKSYSQGPSSLPSRACAAL